MTSLAVLAAAMALIVQPNNGQMYIVEDLSADICADAAFIAENGKTRTQFEAEMAAYMARNPTASGYASQNFARAYCVPQKGLTENHTNSVTNSVANTTGGDSNNGSGQNAGNATSATIPAPKQKAPAGCGTTLACGGYDK